MPAWMPGARQRQSDSATHPFPAFERRPADPASKAANPPPPPASPTRRALLPPPLLPWQRVRRALCPDPQAYMNGLGTLGPTARPSALQPLHGNSCGPRAPSSLCRPVLAPCGTRLTGLPTGRAGQLLPTAAAQCYLSLGTVKGLPHSGVAERRPCRHVVRLCLYDGRRFHGNAVEPRHVKPGRHGNAWTFDAASLLIRCPLERLKTMQIYIEFNVSHELRAEEAQRLPRSPRQAARQVDEVCVAWALVSLATLPSLHEARSLHVPLCGGRLTLRRGLRECQATAVRAAGGPGQAKQKTSCTGSGGAGSSLPIKLCPVPCNDLAALLLPAAAVASLPLAGAVGLYRQLLAEAAGAPEGGATLAPVADPVLAAFPAILDDAELAAAFFSLWERQQAGGADSPAASTASTLRAGFQLCVVAVWAAAGAQAVPAPTAANHGSRCTERRRQLSSILQLHPVVGLSHAGHAWMHRPLEAEELCWGSMEQLGATV
ncbi:expressed protein [Chlorella variabilis]|uniref:Expressed protein n=1 Tax=Chlorella variabilis TaxID=554065 RepID=E1ZL32_CHLVA|nr:expressed protein [Chlorella variabilis]EFN53588.1 expressed protein [Chlorella variabilis]|eukprot:XP_005845690.1 expressed protein [Chlorella variabilis]